MDSRIALKKQMACVSDCDDMSKVPEDIQEQGSSNQTHDETSPKEVGSSPDIVLEHGSTRLSLDLDGWEWFWFFLAICFVGSVWINFF